MNGHEICVNFVEKRIHIFLKLFPKYYISYRDWYREFFFPSVKFFFRSKHATKRLEVFIARFHQWISSIPKQSLKPRIIRHYPTPSTSRQSDPKQHFIQFERSLIIEWTATLKKIKYSLFHWSFRQKESPRLRLFSQIRTIQYRWRNVRVIEISYSMILLSRHKLFKNN